MDHSTASRERVAQITGIGCEYAIDCVLGEDPIWEVRSLNYLSGGASVPLYTASTLARALRWVARDVEIDSDF